MQKIPYFGWKHTVQVCKPPSPIVHVENQLPCFPQAVAPPPFPKPGPFYPTCPHMWCVFRLAEDDIGTSEVFLIDKIIFTRQPLLNFLQANSRGSLPQGQPSANQVPGQQSLWEGRRVGMEWSFPLFTHRENITTECYTCHYAAFFGYEGWVNIKLFNFICIKSMHNLSIPSYKFEIVTLLTEIWLLELQLIS